MFYIVEKIVHIYQISGCDGVYLKLAFLMAKNVACLDKNQNPM